MTLQPTHEFLLMLKSPAQTVINSLRITTKILSKLQNTCYTLQSRAATCNGFKKSPQSLQEVELSSIASIPQCNFLFNLCCNGVARKVAGSLQGVTFPLSNLSRDFFRLARIAQSRAPLYLLQRLQAICFEYP